MDYKEYEKQRDENIKRNEKFLEQFENYMIKENLSKKTIKKHYSNVELYINEFLNYYEIQKMEHGCYEADSYLGNWYIEKCLFASKSSIKESATAIKKFYKCMLEHKNISEDDYNYLCESIKIGLDEWLESLDDFDNGTYFDIW